MKSVSTQPSLFKIFFDRFRRPILLLVFFIIFGCGYFVVLAIPLDAYHANLSLMNQLDHDIAMANTELATAKSYSSQLYQLTSDDNRLLNLALPNHPDSASLITHLTSMAERSGFMVNNIDIDEVGGRTSAVDTNKQLGKIAVNMKLKGGDYEQLKQFLTLIESSIMMVDVYSINFTSQASVYDVALVVYYFNAK